MNATSHILLVDDDENIRLAFRHFFLDTKFVMDEAADAETAYRQLAAHHYDIVISDSNLGGESGITLCAHIKKIFPELPVIIITGYPAHIGETRTHSNGASCLLLKPLDLAKLRSAIGACLSTGNEMWHK